MQIEVRTEKTANTEVDTEEGSRSTVSSLLVFCGGKKEQRRCYTAGKSGKKEVCWGFCALDLKHSVQRQLLSVRSSVLGLNVVTVSHKSPTCG